MSESSDIFDLKLESTSLNMQNCQQSKNLDSCMKCEHMIGCEIRKEYVKAVYESMSKGQQGDFEF